MSSTRDWKSVGAEAERLEAELAALVEPVAALFASDASASKQLKRLVLVVEALGRLAERAGEELGKEAIHRQSVAARREQLERWRDRVDELREEEDRPPSRGWRGLGGRP